MGILDVVTNTGFVLIYTILLALPLMNRLFELIRWNNGVCKNSDRKWKKHSTYPNGDILYTDRSFYMVVSNPHIIDKTENDQLKSKFAFVFYLICLVLACIVSAYLSESETSDLVKFITLMVPLSLPTFYMLKQLIKKVEILYNEYKPYKNSKARKR